MVRSVAVASVLIIQIPGISGYFQGMEDFNGVVHYGWAGYGLGLFCAQIGALIGYAVVLLFVKAVMAFLKED